MTKLLLHSEGHVIHKEEVLMTFCSNLMVMRREGR